MNDVAPRILVVDDEPDILKMIRAELERAGYAVETAGDGETALSRIRTAPPDLLIADLTMPGTDGATLISAIRRDPVLHLLPTILLTQKTTWPDTPGFGAGPSDVYLCKPFAPEALLAFVKRLFKNCQVVKYE